MTATIGTGMSGTLSGSGVSAPFVSGLDSNDLNAYCTPFRVSTVFGSAQGQVSLTASLDGGTTFSLFAYDATVFKWSRAAKIMPPFKNAIFRLEWSIASGSVQYKIQPLGTLRANITDDHEYRVRVGMADFPYFDTTALLPTAQDIANQAAAIKANDSAAIAQTTAIITKKQENASVAAKLMIKAILTPISSADLASLTTAYVICRSHRLGAPVFAIATLSIPPEAQRATGLYTEEALALLRVLRVSSAQVTAIVDDAGNAINTATGWNDLTTGAQVTDAGGTPAIYTVGQTFTAPSYDLLIRTGGQDDSGAYGIFCFPSPFEAMALFGIEEAGGFVGPTSFSPVKMGFVHQSDVPYPEVTSLPA